MSRAMNRNLRTAAFLLGTALGAFAVPAHANTLSIGVQVNVVLLPAPVRCSSTWSAGGVPVADCHEVRGSTPQQAAGDTKPAASDSSEARRLAPATSWQRLPHGGGEHVALTVAW
jgi:hypothetical protein